MGVGQVLPRQLPGRLPPRPQDVPNDEWARYRAGFASCGRDQSHSGLEDGELVEDRPCPKSARLVRRQTLSQEVLRGAKEAVTCDGSDVGMGLGWTLRVGVRRGVLGATHACASIGRLTTDDHPQHLAGHGRVVRQSAYHVRRLGSRVLEPASGSRQPTDQRVSSARGALLPTAHKRLKFVEQLYRPKADFGTGSYGGQTLERWQYKMPGRRSRAGAGTGHRAVHTHAALDDQGRLTVWR